MQQYCTSGSVEGVMGDHDSYSDSFDPLIQFEMTPLTGASPT